MLPSPAPASAVRFGPFTFESSSGQLSKHGIRLRLQPQPAQILAILILHRGKVVSRETIRTAVWGESTFVDFENGLNKAVMKIREVLNDSSDCPQYIETLPKIGYRFVAEVEYLLPATAPRPRPVTILPPPGEAPTPRPPAPLPAWNSRRALLTAAPVAAGTAAAGYWFGYRRTNLPGPVHLSLALPPHLSFDDVGYYGSPLSFSPDGSEVVVAAREGRTIRLYRRKLGNRNFEPVPGSEHARSPAYSADGKYLLFVNPNERKLKRVPLEGGKVEVLYGARIKVLGVQQSEDGRLWFGDCGTGLVCRRTDGTIARITSTEFDLNERGLLDNEHAFPEVLPGGRKVIYTTWTSDDASGLQLIDLEKKTRTPLARPGVTAKYFPRTGHLVYAWHGSVYSVPFDPDREVLGRPSVALQGVAYDISSSATFYAASSNGSLAYIEGQPQHAIGPRVWMNWKGEIDKTSNLPYFLNNSRISPDGKRICFNEAANEAGGNAIWVYEISTGRRHRVTDEKVLARFPIWTPDGKEIVFTRMRGASSGRGELNRISAEGGGEARPLATDSQGNSPGAISPDGRWLVYVSETTKDYKAHVRVLDLRRSGARSAPLVDMDIKHEQIQPALSPDGRWVAMVTSELSKEKEVVIRAFDNPRRAYKVSEGGGWQPVWSPEGQDLYFFDTSGTKLMAASIAVSGGTPRIGAPRAVLTGRFLPWYGGLRIWDIHPDGKRFLVVTRAAKEPRASLVEIVLNWDGTLPGRA